MIRLCHQAQLCPSRVRVVRTLGFGSTEFDICLGPEGAGNVVRAGRRWFFPLRTGPWRCRDSLRAAVVTAAG